MGSRHQLGDEEVEDHSGALEEACMRKDQGEDSTENLEHEAHFLASEIQQSSEAERRGMHEVDKETAQSSYAFHFPERHQPRELDGKLQA
jgi:hypothetical protein